MKEVELVGVRVEMPSNTPIVVLREIAGDRHLPIWIGPAEASAIVMGQQGVQAPRPLTHDLIKDLLATLGRSLSRVEIVDLKDKVFYSRLVLDDGSTTECRTSDAVAIALRCNTPIVCDEAVLDEGGMVIETEDQDEVERFREFLDNVSPDDFVGEGGSH